MARSDTSLKQERIIEVDLTVLNPQERAEAVWEVLQKAAPDLTDWDVVCFAVNYLGFASSNLEWLRKPAMDICKLVYTAHYLVTEATDVSSGIKRNTGEAPTLASTAREVSTGKRESFSAGSDVTGDELG